MTGEQIGALPIVASPGHGGGGGGGRGSRTSMVDA